MGLRIVRWAVVFAVAGFLLLAGISPVAAAQVFTVGMRTATDDAVVDFTPTRLQLSTQGLDQRTQRELLRGLTAEQGFAHRGLPLASNLTLLANGNMTPAGDDYRRLLYEKGIASAPGDRVEISAVQFKGDRILIDLNGGPYAKHRFLSHVQIDNTDLAPTGDRATGSRVTLVFEGSIPEITAAEVKALLAPILDFTAKSDAEAYANTMPPKVREAVAAHEVLVGMDRRMVLAAVGAPLSKDRERLSSDPGISIEEWIYGEPPQPVKFVRFKGDKVIRVEIAAIGQPIQVFDKDQLHQAPVTDPLLQPGVHVVADGDIAPAVDGDDTPHSTAPPTLRKPGDTIEAPPTQGRVVVPEDKPDAAAPKLLSTPSR
jgi:hypothetical protein